MPISLNGIEKTYHPRSFIKILLWTNSQLEVAMVVIDSTLRWQYKSHLESLRNLKWKNLQRRRLSRHTCLWNVLCINLYCGNWMLLHFVFKVFPWLRIIYSISFIFCTKPGYLIKIYSSFGMIITYLISFFVFHYDVETFLFDYFRRTDNWFLLTLWRQRHLYMGTYKIKVIKLIYKFLTIRYICYIQTLKLYNFYKMNYWIGFELQLYSMYYLLIQSI